MAEKFIRKIRTEIIIIIITLILLVGYLFILPRIWPAEEVAEPAPAEAPAEAPAIAPVEELPGVE